jgi:L-alanine-DL-glutamate epimerase-like enolase superfamily enzyme
MEDESAMSKLTRRRFLASTVGAAAVLGTGGLTSVVPNDRRTDIRIEEIRHSYEDYLYRTPMKFGGQVVDRVTLLNVHCVVRRRDGKTAKGFGSMPLGNVWAFPSRQMNYDTTLGAMKALAERVAHVTGACPEYGHPIDLNGAMEPEYLKAAEEVSKALALVEPIPKLATLTTASPFDAAVHDGYGKVQGVSAYQTYSPEFMHHDLAHYLGPAFKGEPLSRYVLTRPKPRMPLYHLVGALDPLDTADVQKPIGDGLPETLAAWIPYNGLTHLKIKLNGDDLAWDVDRVVRIDRVAAEAQIQCGVSQWYYSADFNERCPNVDYLLAFLRQVREQTPAGFDRIQYIEQPTARDLRRHRDNVMYEASKLRPVVIDESLTDLESLVLSCEMGYTGVALKACKGQSQALLMGAAAQKHKMFLCVQA